jgi:hypothetical protein
MRATIFAFVAAWVSIFVITDPSKLKLREIQMLHAQGPGVNYSTQFCKNHTKNLLALSGITQLLVLSPKLERIKDICIKRISTHVPRFY